MNMIYRAGDFGEYSFRVYCMGSGSYRVEVTDGDNEVVIVQSETRKERATGLCDGLRAMVYHCGTAKSLDDLRKYKCDRRDVGLDAKRLDRWLA